MCYGIQYFSQFWTFAFIVVLAVKRDISSKTAASIPHHSFYISLMEVTGYVFSIQYILRSGCGELLKQDFVDEILRHCFHPILRLKFERLKDTFPQTGFS